MKQFKDSKALSYGITKIGLFGSVARGKQYEGSDVDVEQEKTKNMTQLILTINDESMLSKIKMLKGVIDVRTVKEKKIDITETVSYKEAMEDVKAGRVYHTESTEDMFQ